MLKYATHNRYFTESDIRFLNDKKQCKKLTWLSAVHTNW